MRTLAIGFILIFFSCSQSSADKDIVQYVNGRQLLNLNGFTRDGKPLGNPKVERISPDTISVKEEFLAKIFITDKNYYLVDAYFDCETIENPTVDTAVNTNYRTKRLSGCTRGLYVENDTIFISFMPDVAGAKSFSEIIILTKDSDNLFRTQKYTFDYYVQ